MSELRVRFQRSRPADTAGVPVVVEVFDTELDTVGRPRAMYMGDELPLPVPPGIYAVQARLPSGVALHRTFQVGDEPVTDAALDLRPATIGGPSERAVALIEPTRNIARSDLSTEELAGGFLRLWQETPDGEWRISPFAPVERWHAREAVRWRLELDQDHRFAVQVGADTLASRFVVVPPQANLDITVSARGDEIATAVTGVELADGIMACLRRGAVEDAGHICDDLVDARSAEPAVAVAAGYYLLRVYRLDDLRPWVADFADANPWLPDSAVIDGWLQIQSARLGLVPRQRAMLYARSRFYDSIIWGVPVYAEGLRLMAEGLRILEAELPGDDLTRLRRHVTAFTGVADGAAQTTTYLGGHPAVPDRVPWHRSPDDGAGVALLVPPAPADTAHIPRQVNPGEPHNDHDRESEWSHWSGMESSAVTTETATPPESAAPAAETPPGSSDPGQAVARFRAGPVGRVLLWCAASDRSLVPNRVEYYRYTGIGLSILLTASVSGLLFTLTAITISGSFSMPFILLALLWATLIFFVDRSILAEPSYGDVVDLELGYAAAPGRMRRFRVKGGRGLSYLLRFVMAVIISVLMSEAALLLVFQAEIRSELSVIHQERIASLAESARQSSADQITTLTRQIQDNNRRLQGAETDVKTKAAAWQGEVYGQSPSGSPGNGPVAKELQRQLDDAQQFRNKVQADVQKANDQDRREINAINERLTSDVQEQSKAINADNGWITREAGLDRFLADNSDKPMIALWPWLLRILFLTIELLPLSLKLFGRRTIYDRNLEAQGIILASEAEWQARAIRRQIDRDHALAPGRRPPTP
ncbi:DUF4407 domain-containing protein [Actinoplanes sp. NPDC026619]|uniref:DUF4407 domain-containing protein n=1 Tax=Actinoplanes sp. NPDC026619 TaxID=3155798 RepID=UPI0033CA92FD